jgi:hypothetical protein
MCCGNRVVTARAAQASTQWVVVHADGRETVKSSEVSAKLAAARSPGATVEQRRNG